MMLKFLLGCMLGLECLLDRLLGMLGQKFLSERILMSEGARKVFSF